MKRVSKIKTSFVAITAALILGTAVGGTLAYIITRTDAVTNTFTPGEVTCNVNETFSNNTKSNVTVTNTGDTAAYIRVAVVANWYDSAGNIVEPWSINELEINSSSWEKGSDGYFYYKSAVPVDGTTEALFSSYSPNAKANLQLKMDIIAQAIQSTPTQAVKDQWRVSVGSDGKISKNN